MPTCVRCGRPVRGLADGKAVCSSCGAAVPTGEETVLGTQAAGGPHLSREQIATLWSPAVRPDHDATMTIKPRRREAPAEREATSSVSQRLNLRQSRVVETGQPVEPPPQYEILNVLGEGGMGVVYAARQTSVDRQVALKMIKRQVASDKDNRNKFLSEAVATADLSHPNIVPVYDLGSNDEGVLFYAMKEVKGTSWKDVIKEKALGENLEILMRVADAVAFAHSKGIIHRDLKPENVMLGDFGEVLLMDWGLAASVNEAGKADRLSDANGFGGTPCYMAPEMVSGDLGKLGTRTDVYLLGAILYEVVTGQRPRVSKNPFECLEQAGANHIEPTEKTGELLEIARRAMSTAPEDRFSDVKDIQAAIRECRTHAESIALASAAQEGLARARQSGQYDDYAQALFGFREALRLWGANGGAKTGLSAVGSAYAECAFGKGDFDLAASLLDSDEPAHAELLKRVRAGSEERRARQQRLKVARRMTVGLGLMVVVLSSVGFFWIRHEQAKTLAEKARAEQALHAVVVEQARKSAEERKRREAEEEQAKLAKQIEREHVQRIAERNVVMQEALGAATYHLRLPMERVKRDLDGIMKAVAEKRNPDDLFVDATNAAASALTVLDRVSKVTEYKGEPGKRANQKAEGK